VNESTSDRSCRLTTTYLRVVEIGNQIRDLDAGGHEAQGRGPNVVDQHPATKAVGRQDVLEREHELLDVVESERAAELGDGLAARVALQLAGRRALEPAEARGTIDGVDRTALLARVRSQRSGSRHWHRRRQWPRGGAVNRQRDSWWRWRGRSRGARAGTRRGRRSNEASSGWSAAAARSAWARALGSRRATAAASEGRASTTCSTASAGSTAGRGLAVRSRSRSSHRRHGLGAGRQGRLGHYDLLECLEDLDK